MCRLIWMLDTNSFKTRKFTWHRTLLQNANAVAKVFRLLKSNGAEKYVLKTYENRSEMFECSTYEIHGVLELGKAIGHSDFGSVKWARGNMNEKNMQKWIFVPMLHWRTKRMLSIFICYIWRFSYRLSAEEWYMRAPSVLPPVLCWTSRYTWSLLTTCLRYRLTWHQGNIITVLRYMTFCALTRIEHFVQLGK